MNVMGSIRTLLTVMVVLTSLSTSAGEFGVSPLRIDLDNANRNGVLTVSNDGNAPLRVTVKLMKWTQSSSGEDTYSESDALLFFPRSLSIDPMELRVIRIGLKAPVGGTQSEQAFRLYIEEAAQDEFEKKKNQVKFRFRFGIPIFAVPADRKVAINLEKLSVESAKLIAMVANTGTETVRFETFNVSAPSRWEENGNGLYHHPGTQRRYEMSIPASECIAGRTLKLQLKGEKATLEREITLAAENCVQGK